MGTSGHRRLAYDWWCRSLGWLSIHHITINSIGQVTGIRLLSKLPSAMKLSGFVDVSEVTYSWPHTQSYRLVIFTPTHPPSPHTQCKVSEPGSQLGPDAQSGLDKLGVSVGDEQLERIAIVQVHPPLHHHGSFIKPPSPSTSGGTCL